MVELLSLAEGVVAALYLRSVNAGVLEKPRLAGTSKVSTRRSFHPCLPTPTVAAARRTGHVAEGRPTAGPPSHV